MSDFDFRRSFGLLPLLCFGLASCYGNTPGSPANATPESGEPPPEVGAQVDPQTAPTPVVDRAPSEILSNRIERHPKYPVQAVRDRAEGKVVLKVLVNAEGKPEEIALEKSSGSEDLDRAAIKAVETWDFNPGMKKGIPAPGYLLVPMEFNLNQ